MADRALLHRVHNPHNRSCGCDADCWCNRTAVGTAVKWWFPARWFGIRHKTTFIDGMTRDERVEWKREQNAPDGLHKMSGWQAQPQYEQIVRLGRIDKRGPLRYGLTVRGADGETAVHELGRLPNP